MLFNEYGTFSQNYLSTQPNVPYILSMIYSYIMIFYYASFNVDASSLFLSHRSYCQCKNDNINLQ